MNIKKINASVVQFKIHFGEPVPNRFYSKQSLLHVKGEQIVDIAVPSSLESLI